MSALVRPRAWRATLLLIGFAPIVSLAQAPAEPTCRLGDSIEQCWKRHNPDPAKQAAVAAKSEEAKLKNLETGLDGGAPELATTTRNLLPFLTASGLLADSDGDSSDQLYTIDLNFLIGGGDKDHNTQLKAVLNNDPQLFAPLKQAVDTASGGTDRAGELKKGLSATDDYAISLTYSHINKRFGRSFAQYRSQFSSLFESALSAAGATAEDNAALLAFADLVQKLNAEDGRFVPKTLADLAVVETAAAKEAALEKRVGETFARHSLARFAELVNNQPQLTASIDVHERDVLVGANERAVRIGFEWGFANVNDLVKSSRGACNVLGDNVTVIEAEAAKTCLNAYSTYLAGHEQSLKNADRVSVELSYVAVDDYDFASATDNVTLARDSTKRLDFSVGYGRTLQVIGTDKDSRLDIVAKYEDYSDDPDHRDRMVTTVTFTTKLNGISVPFALVYANHGKYLPEADKKLSAHLGFKYQLDSK